ncbi:cytochrome P450 [Aquabacterium sp. A7-Y]|uniref:cytochrome P450 n=1 Tax=Aquabacterium sp. A7-Y TaxID=1349605 RepID=UPI00223D18E5|nr:cytochrome P450 [Aquabacterium sp. A7-Y]MCW7536891.1 cytochrome P450 [Aquabacterium sp. A7-Y]
MSTSRFAPGPAGHALLGCFSEFRDRPLELLLRCRREYGSVVRLPLGLGLSVGLVYHPEHLQTVFHDARFGRSDLAALFEPLAGGSMIIADGEPWKRQRKAVAPSFGQEMLRRLAPEVEKEAEALAERWRSAARQGQEVDLQSEMVSYAMSTLTLFLLGRPLTAREVGIVAPAWTRSLICMNTRLSQPVPIPMWMPTRTNRELRQSAHAIAEVLLACIREHRALPHAQGGASFLAGLARHRDEETGEGLSDEQILREIMGVFLAGFDTVASAMMWTLYDLTRHPDWQQAVREEVDAPGDNARTDLQDCPVLDRVFNESIRLMPPLWLVDRKCSEPVELGRFTLPAHTNVITSPYVTHRDPELWSDPERFDPDRFLPSAQAGRPRYAHFPFGGGRMKCIGIGLALLELKALLRAVLPVLRLEPGSTVQPELEPAFVLRTRNSLWVRARAAAGRPRSGAPRPAADAALLPE